MKFVVERLFVIVETFLKTVLCSSRVNFLWMAGRGGNTLVHNIFGSEFVVQGKLVLLLTIAW